MRSPKVSTAEIDIAIRELLAAGQHPTWERVRSSVGDRGGATSLQRMIREWYAEHGPSLVATGVPPAAGTREVREQLKEMTQAAIMQLEREEADRRAELAARATELESEAAALAEQQRMLEARTADLDARVAGAEARALVAEEARRAAEQNAVQDRAARSDAERAAAEAEEKVREWHTTITLQQTALERAGKEEAERITQLRVANEKIQTLQSALEAATAAGAQCQSDLAAERDRASKSLARMASLEATLVASEKEVERLASDLARTERDARRWDSIEARIRDAEARRAEDRTLLVAAIEAVGKGHALRDGRIMQAIEGIHQSDTLRNALDRIRSACRIHRQYMEDEGAIDSSLSFASEIDSIARMAMSAFGDRPRT